MSSWCPPMFDEAPQKYTNRLFLYASDEVAELLRQKYKIKGYVSDDYDYMAHMAWLIGATSGAQALIREIDLVKSAWGKGDDQKALSLTKVCTAHTISTWLGGIDPQLRLAEDRRVAWYEDAARSMLGIINKSLSAKTSDTSTMTAQDVRSAIDMDRQWNSERAGGGPPLAYACLLLSRALEACGERCIDWGRLSLPVDSIQQLLGRNAIVNPRLPADGQGLRAVLDSVEQGVQSMKRYYVMNMEGKVLPSRKA